MKKQNRRLRRGGPVDIVFTASGDATIEAAAGDDPGVPTVTVKAYTGDKLSLRTFPHPVVIDVAGVKAMDGDQLPFLKNHVVESPVGHGKPEITASGLNHSGPLSVPGEDRDSIVEASNNGFHWQASVGGRIPNRRANVKTIGHGDRIQVNGRTIEGPAHIVKAFLWKETSFCSVGADEGRASAAIAAQHDSYVQKDYPMNEFDKWLVASGFNADDMSDTQLDAVRASYDNQAAPTAPADPVNVEALTASLGTGLRTEMRDMVQRDRRVDRLFATYADSSMSSEDRQTLRDEVEAGNVSEDQAHLRLIQSGRVQASTGNAGGRVCSDQDSLNLEAALSRTAGLNDDSIRGQLSEVRATSDQTDIALQESSSAGRFRNIGLKDIINAACQQAGHSYFGSIGNEELRCALGHGQDIEATSGFSTISLTGILSRLANKAMLASYAEADNGGVAFDIASTTSTPDFKKFDRYRMTETGIMEQVAASGEIKHGSLTEEGYENQVKTYGKIIALTRQMMINDDLDAFLQIPRMIGRMARHSLEQITITTLVDAPTSAAAGTTEFFHGAARGNQQPNYFEGAATNLSMDSLEIAYELFLNQVDSDGKPIMIDPAILLCTNGDIVLARKLWNDTEYRFTIDAIRETINNQWQGMFTPTKSSYLSLLGAVPSAVQWYLLSSPTTDVSAIQLAFLNGVQTPVIERGEVSFNVLGAQWRGVYDFGVGLQDPRAITKSKGAA